MKGGFLLVAGTSAGCSESDNFYVENEQIHIQATSIALEINYMVIRHCLGT
jgi:hypothetical protein